MDTLAICFSGFLFLVLFAFLLSFYREIARTSRIKAAKRKRLNTYLKHENTDHHKSTLKIPGYYEELSKRTKRDEHYSRSKPTVI